MKNGKESISYSDLSDFTRKKRICSNYSNNSTKYLTSEKVSDTEDNKGFSVSFAAGIKLDYKDKSGFSLKVMTPEEIANEQNRTKKRLRDSDDEIKGSNLNLYC
jgi:hypothetical protein